MSAIENYKSLVRECPNIQDTKYVGLHWKTIINNNSKEFVEPDISWIDNAIKDIKSVNIHDSSQNGQHIKRNNCGISESTICK